MGHGVLEKKQSGLGNKVYMEQDLFFFSIERAYGDFRSLIYDACKSINSRS